MRKFQAATCLFWLGALTAIAGCAAQASPSPKEPPPASVTTAKITRGTIATYATFDGQITPVTSGTLSYRAPLQPNADLVPRGGMFVKSKP